MVDDGRSPCTYAESAALARRGGITPYKQEVAGSSPVPPIVTKHDAEPFADAGRGCRKPLWWAEVKRRSSTLVSLPSGNSSGERTSARIAPIDCHAVEW